MGSSAGMPSLAGACVLAAVLRPGSALQRLCTSAHRCRRWVRLSWPARLLGLLPGEERAPTLSFSLPRHGLIDQHSWERGNARVGNAVNPSVNHLASAVPLALRLPDSFSRNV